MEAFSYTSNVVREEASGGRAALAHVTQESLTCLVNIARKQFHMSCAYMYAGDHKATSAARQGDSCCAMKSLMICNQ